MSHPNDRGGPYPSVVILSDGVRSSDDDGLSTKLTRVVSSTTVPTLGTTVSLRLVVVFYGGVRRGQTDLVVTIFGPTGEYPGHVESFRYEGSPFDSTRFDIPIAFVADGVGPYWFDVRVGDHFLSRVPLVVNLPGRRYNWLTDDPFG